MDTSLLKKIARIRLTAFRKPNAAKGGGGTEAYCGTFTMPMSLGEE